MAEPKTGKFKVGDHVAFHDDYLRARGRIAHAEKQGSRWTYTVLPDTGKDEHWKSAKIFSSLANGRFFAAELVIYTGRTEAQKRRDNRKWKAPAGSISKAVLREDGTVEVVY